MSTKINKRDDIVMKLVHYFITEENYKPIVVNGVQNEIWLENMDKDIKLIRLNVNYIHNNEQFMIDLRKADIIRKSIKKKTYTFSMNLLNLLIDSREEVNVEDNDNISTIKVKTITELKKNKLINEYFPNIKEKIATKKSDIVDMFKMTDDMNSKTEREEKKLSKLFQKRISFMTYIIIAINALIYAIMLQPDIFVYMINTFANYYENVQNGEFYRLVTACFLHINLIHIFFNMYALNIVGPEIERYYGRLKFLCIYIVSGIVGCLFSCLFTTSVSIGASGAIFGMFGALLYFCFNYRATLDGYLRGSLIPLILINLLIGFIVPGIDISAHIGGLIGGFISSMAVGLKTKEKKKDRINGIIMMLILVIFLIYMLMSK